jgi:TRAP-type C4-dicarboxylate transport system substrate-binding protein
MLVGMPILTAFNYFDIGKHITDLRFAEIVSVTVMNEDWFQEQNAEVQAAILEAGRAAEAAVFDWGVENVARTYAIWEENGGVINTLSPEEQARMEAEFAALADSLLEAEPAVRAEYDRLLALVEAHRAE